MASESLLLVVAPVSNRLETPGILVILSADIPRAISPRAPPIAGSIG